MAGFSIGNTGITNARTLTESIRDGFLNGGSTGWFVQVNSSPLDTPTYYKILMESSVNVDAYLSTDPTQKYRIYLWATKDVTGAYTSLTLYFGDASQISMNGDGTDVVLQPNTPSILLFNAASAPSNTNESNYRMTLTDRGWALGIWPISKVNNVSTNVSVVMQRPVNPTTGLPKIEGTAPIFALWKDASFSNGYFEWAIVREKDASPSVSIGNTSLPTRYNMYRISLDWPHPNLFDNNSHVVKFPYGLATFRHLYLDELDLICFVNASAFASQQDVRITMYGEADERKYKTVWGDVQYSTTVTSGGVTTRIPKIVSGTRIGILFENGGVDTP